MEATEIEVMPKRKHAAIEGKRADYIRANAKSLLLVVQKDHFLYDPRVEEPLDPEFVASIKRDGVLEPILYWKDKDGQPLVVAGRQRVRAARETDVLVPAIAIDTKGLSEQEIKAKLVGIMILENEKRLEDSPSGKAIKTRRYMDLLGGDKKLVAERLSITTKTIEARLKFIEQPAPVQQLVDQGKIGFWAATELSKLPAKEQVEQAGRLAELGLPAADGKKGRKASIEDAKRAAGKGKSKEREALERAEEALKDAAYALGAARRNGAKDYETKEFSKTLTAAALDFYVAAKKAEGKK